MDVLVKSAIANSSFSSPICGESELCRGFTGAVDNCHPTIWKVNTVNGTVS